MEIKTVKTIWADDELRQNTHIIECENSCIVVDAGCPPNEIKEVTDKPIEAVLLTHGHFDHIRYVEEYDKLDVPIIANEHIVDLLNSPSKNLSDIFSSPTKYKVKNLVKVKDNQTLNLAGEEVKCIYTPGHSLDSMCYLVGDLLFSGDCLFAVAIGRTDFPTSSTEDMITSLNKLNQTPFKTLYTGHGRKSTRQEQNFNLPGWIIALTKEVNSKI